MTKSVRTCWWVPGKNSCPVARKALTPRVEADGVIIENRLPLEEPMDSVML